MPLYAYYFCREDGAAPAFEVHEAHTAAQARARAPELLKAHPSCAYVTVFEDEQELFTLRRPPGASPGFAAPIYTPGAIAEVLSATRLGRTGAAIIATTSKGDVTYWSPRAVRLYGWSVEQALGRNVLDLTPALQSRAEAESIMDRLRTGEPWEGEIVLRHKSGAPFSAYVCNVPVGRLSDGDGAIVGVSVAGRDRPALEGSCRALARELGLRMMSLDEASQNGSGASHQERTST